MSATRRQLDAPLVLASDTVYADTDFVLGPGFCPTTVGAALYGPHGVRRVVVRNCTLRTPWETYAPAWASDPLWRILAGLRLDSPQDLAVDGLLVEGFPNCGFTAHAMQTAKLERVSVTRCLMGASFPWVEQASRNVRIDGYRAWDLWGPGPGRLDGFGGSPSRLRPGGWSGGDGLAGYFEDSILARLDFSGELYGGLKLVRSKRVCVIDVATNVMMIQGTQDVDANVDGMTDGSEAITVRRVLIDKRRGQGEASDAANAFQVSRHVTGLDVAEYSILGAAGLNGHAIELANGCEASFRGGVIDGFAGTRGGVPCAAMNRLDTSRYNADFAAANRFGASQRVFASA